MTNTPYVKKYDKDGQLTNPIEGNFINEFPNRRSRHELKQTYRFYGESKNYHLTVKGILKYHRVKQIVVDKKIGDKKIIEHYILS
ncbi:MAG: hypothetical protein M0R17_08570 [Candidatus Omnitrophica bacterium]|jgi:hypothetical protein|nr:hypothetical protein [Candidatus Omnitrophota bacterium]